VFPKSNQRVDQNLNLLSQHVDPMCYPLLHVNGEPGWRPGLKHVEEFR
jgi:hypothetical protein